MRNSRSICKWNLIVCLLSSISGASCYTDHSVPNVGLNKLTYSSSQDTIGEGSLAVDGDRLDVSSSMYSIFRHGSQTGES